MGGEGWVESWVRRFIGKKDAPLAGAMVHLNPAWTRQTHLVMWLAPPVLAMIWAFHRHFPASAFRDSANVWIGILAFALPVGALLPVSNEVPRATALWPLGGQGLPFFSALPVSVRDVLRISQRITLARCLILVPLMTPIVAALLAIFDEMDFSPWTACWLVPAATCFWVTSRPVFLCHRLRGAGRRSNSWSIHTLLELLTLIATLGWLIAGLIGVGSGLLLFSSGFGGPDRWVVAAAGLGGLLVSGLCARAVFEIHCWKLQRRMLDWLSFVA